MSVSDRLSGPFLDRFCILAGHAAVVDVNKSAVFTMSHATRINCVYKPTGEFGIYGR